MVKSTYGRKLRGIIEKLSEKYPNCARILKNGGDRAVLFTAVSMAVGLLFCIYNAVLAVVYGIAWNAVLAGYYFLLVLVKTGILFGFRRTCKGDDPVRDDIVAYLVAGLTMLVMHIAVVSLVIRLNEGESFHYAGVIIYGYALYAFVKIIAAIVNLVKTRKRKLSLVTQAIRNINLADAAISILALQTAMLSEFGSFGNANRITGGAICAIIMLMSVYMIIRASVLLTKYRRIESGRQS